MLKIMLMKKVNHKLDCWNKQLRTRTRMIVSNHDSNILTVNGTKCINFSSNDYLGLAKHPKIMAAFIKGANKYGFGSGSSSLLAGYFDVQHELEMRFARWLRVDKTILFNSGYLANIGVISSLADRSCTIFSDKLCHASILDGIQLSRARHYRYKHNSIEDLTRLTKLRQPTLIVTEAVFSMEGDIAPIKDIVAIAHKQKASLIIDDAHGIGVLGNHGGGIFEHAGITQNQVACLITPLGKAFNGPGAIVAGKSDVIEAILQFARSYRYTTAMPPAICSALITSLDVVQNDNWRRIRLKELIQFFTENTIKRGLSLTSSDLTSIKSIIIGDNHSVTKLQAKMLAKGFYISCIRPPTVPEKTARVRISLNCLHTEKQIINLLDYISEYRS